MWSKRHSVMVASFLILLAAGTPLYAQHPQGHTQPPTSREADSAGPPTTLGSLLRASDEAMRALEAAVEDADRQLAVRWAEGYVAAAEALADYAGGADLARIARDLSRADAALERQTKLLRELSARAPRELRDALGAALDAARRAGDTIRAAREEARSAGAGVSHHQSERRGGCGHH
jgi:hypothetical protein